MKKFQLGFTKPIIHMIIRMMIILLVLGSFAPSAYSQIATTTPASRCLEGTLVLHATATSGTIKWYDVPFYGTAVATGDSFTTPSMSVTKTYYVDAVDAGNCSSNTNQARVPVIATISAGSIQAAIFYTSNTFCKSVSGDQLVTRTGTAGGVYSATAGGLTLNSSTGAITPSSSTNGTYTVTYHITTPADGCTEADATTPVTITTTPTTPVIKYDATPTTPISYCTTAGTITVIHTGASGGTYSASPSGLTIDASTGTITPATSLSGTYTVTYFVSGLGGCNAMTAQATDITILQLPTANISYATPFCNSAASNTVTLNGTGVYTGGTFTATGGLAIDSSTGAISTPATAGTYTITYTLTAVSPCAQVVAQTTVVVLPATTATISGTTAICSGGSTNLTIALTGTTPWSFTYTDGATPVTITGQVASTVTIAVSPFSTKTYTLTSVNDAHCAGTFSGSATVTVNTAPLATFEYSGSPFCSNGTDPSPNMLGEGTKGIFSSTEGFVFVSSATGEIDLSASTAGTYTVTNTIAATGGCPEVTHESAVTITKLPIADFSYASAAYCTNGTNPSPVMGGGAVKGLFSSTAGLEFVSLTTGEINLAASTPGNYTVTNTIAAATGCDVVTATASIEIKAIPAALAGSNRGICAGMSTQIGATAVGSNTYSWSASPTDATLTETTSAQPTVSPTVTTIYTVVESNGSCSNTHSMTVSILPLPAANAISGTATVCAGSTLVSYSVTDNSTDGGLYEWQYITGSGATLSSIITPAITINFSSTATSGQLKLTETLGGCPTLNTYDITVNPLPTLASVAQSATVCDGTTATINLTGLLAGSTSTISYTIDGETQTDIAGVSANGSGVGNFTSAALTYANNDKKLRITGILVTSTTPGCTKSFTEEATLTVYANFTSGAIAITGESICYAGTPTEIGSTTAASGGNGTITYEWRSSADSYVAAISGATSATYTPPAGLTATTSYRRYAYDVTCNSTATVSTGTWTVTVYDQFESGAIATTGQTICSGGTPTVIGSTTDASGGHGAITYAWESSLNIDFDPRSSISSNTATYTPAAGLTETTYYRRMAYDITCNPAPTLSTGTWLVTVNPKLIASVLIVASANPVCANSLVTFTATPTNGGTLPEYLWRENGQTTGHTGSTYSYIPTNGKLITVVMTSNASPCLSGSPATSNEITMTVNAIPAAPTATEAQSFCSGASPTVADLAILTGTAPKWYAAETGGTAKETTEALVTATDYWASQIVSGCESSARVKVTATVNDLQTITLGSNPSVCIGTTIANLAYTATTGTPDKYSIDFNGVSETAGFVDVTNADLGATPIVITVPAAPTGGAGTFEAVLTVKNSTTGCISIGYNVSVTVSAATDAGSVTGGYPISSGATSGLLSLGTHTGSITKWQYFVSPFDSWSDISNTNDTYNSDELTQTTQFRALVKSGVCNELPSGATTVTIGDMAIATLPVTSFTSTTADLRMQITGSGITVIGFKYDTSSGFNPSISGTDKSNSPGGTLTFADSVVVMPTTSLTSGQIYYVRAYAIDAFGTTYGNEIRFTTSQ